MRTYRKRNDRRMTRRQKGGNADLMAAVRNGDYVRVVHLIAARANVNYVDPVNDMTPLMIAVRESDPDDIKIVQRLLASGANTNYRSRQGKTPLSEALHYYRSENHLKQIKQLIRAGADVNARNEDGYTPLIQIMMQEMGVYHQLLLVRALIAAGADVNASSETGRQPLSFAINEELRAELVAAGATEAPVRAVAPRRQGLAVEVHDAYDKINKTAFLEFMRGRIGAVPEIPDTMSEHIYNTMTAFMSSLAANSQPKKDLDKVYNRLNQMYFTETDNILIMYTLEFVRRQPADFQLAYASAFAQDCAQAYNTGNTVSCSKGIKERILFSLTPACTVYVDRPEYAGNGYAQLVAILNPPSLKKIIARFSSVCFREGHHTKTTFRACMRQKLQEELGDQYVEDSVSTELENFISELETAGTSLSNNAVQNAPNASEGGGRTRRRRRLLRSRRRTTRC